MAGDYNKFEFNEVSGAHRDKMSQPARDERDLIEKTQKTRETTHQADFKRHQAQRIAQQEEQLRKHHELQHNMPAPRGAPTPRMPTAEQIKEQARHNVQNAHQRERQEMLARHKNDREDHTRKALNMPSRAELKTKDPEREAFMERRRQERLDNKADKFERSPNEPIKR